MTRAEFEAYLLRLLWRSGDTDLTGDLPLIIRMGEARLTRDLIVLRRSRMTSLVADSQLIPYPDDYHAIRLLADPGGAYTYVTPSDWADRIAKKSCERAYTLTGEGILLTGQSITPETPLSLIHSYYTTLPSYTDAETWVQQNYFDLYTHACLINSATYLQADERVGVWNTFYNEELASVIADDGRRTYNGSPLRQRMPGVVA